MYNRILSRILRRNKTEIVSKIFRLVGVAKRPLALEELREALAVDPGQPYSKQERMANNICRVISRCENLVLVNEEEDTVQFAHHTVKTFLLDHLGDLTLRSFHFDQEDANYEFGEICVTYLNFNDFKRQLIKLPKPQVNLAADNVLESSMKTVLHRRLSSPILKLAKAGRSRQHSIDVVEQLSKHTGFATPPDLRDTEYARYPFLSYASVHWLSHCSNFSQEKTQTWRLWTFLVEIDHEHVIRPWTSDEWLAPSRDIRFWILQNDHAAVLRLIEHGHPQFTQKEIDGMLISAARAASMKVLYTLFDLRTISLSTIHFSLIAAASEGHLNVVDWLLKSNLDLNKRSDADGWTALQVAAGGGHLKVVERLLQENADVNSAAAAAAASGGRTALQAAAEGGHLEVVERLLQANADVNSAAAAYGGRTALQAAAGRGHLKVVERLLQENADVNAAAAANSGRTALQAAAGGGYLEVVEWLLQENADVNAAGTSLGGGRTALQAAAGGGHLEVVERLRKAGARK